MLFAKIVTFSSILATAFAAPFVADVVQKRDVVAPKMTSPTADTVWVVGNTYQVTWDTSGLPPPANITNIIGQVVLGQFDANGDEHLQLDTPLAQNFNITSGSVNVVAPNVTAGKYFLVLFGDSGNNGPEFTITTSAASSSASASVSTAPPLSSSPSLVPPITSEPPSTTSSPTSTPLSVPVTSTITGSSALVSSTSVSLLSTPSQLLPTTISGSVNSPLPTSSSNSSASAQQTSNAVSWIRSNSCLTFAVVALSVTLMI
ncbi:hypothetical protein BC835DRAFT_1415605 [Cytidiella melzeri]|nr:hypothetical protein BC835DRAFT_1415605 [Cytidiella melzeri]